MIEGGESRDSHLYIYRYYFNDAHVTKTHPPFGASTSPYMLVYRRREPPILHSDGNLDMETDD